MSSPSFKSRLTPSPWLPQDHGISHGAVEVPASHNAEGGLTLVCLPLAKVTNWRMEVDPDSIRTSNNGWLSYAVQG